MNTKIKSTLVLLSLALNTPALAHTDHALGDGSFHLFYHAVFWGLFAAVIYQGTKWLKTKNNQAKKGLK